MGTTMAKSFVASGYAINYAQYPNINTWVKTLSTDLGFFPSRRFVCLTSVHKPKHSYIPLHNIVVTKFTVFIANKYTLPFKLWLLQTDVQNDIQFYIFKELFCNVTPNLDGFRKKITRGRYWLNYTQCFINSIYVVNHRTYTIVINNNFVCRLAVVLVHAYACITSIAYKGSEYMQEEHNILLLGSLLM